MEIDQTQNHHGRLKASKHGAHITSWVSNGKEQLFLSKKAIFENGVPIRGGVPLCFPQFGAFGPGKKHGFARNIEWALASSSDKHISYTLEANSTTREMWDADFSATFSAVLSENTLDMQLRVENTQDKTFEFTCALHTYFLVDDIEQCKIDGLRGISYWDNGNDFDARAIQENEQLEIHSAIDRVYFDAPQTLQLLEKAKTRIIESTNFPEVVVWNPWIEGTRGLADMDNEEYRKMLCIEAAAIEQPIFLAPGDSWEGTQKITVQPR